MHCAKLYWNWPKYSPNSNSDKPLLDLYINTTNAFPPIFTQSPLPPVTNPCTAEAVAAKKVFFPYPNDPHHFMMCEGVMQVNIMTCPSPLVWDQGRESCVYTVSTTGGQPSVVSTVAPGSVLLLSDKL